MWNFDNCQEKEMVFGFTHHFSSSIASEDLAWLVTWSQRLIHAAAVHHGTYFMCCGHWALIHMVSWWSSWAWGLNHLEFLCPEYCIINNKTICCSLASWPHLTPHCCLVSLDVDSESLSSFRPNRSVDTETEALPSTQPSTKHALQFSYSCKTTTLSIVVNLNLISLVTNAMIRLKITAPNSIHSYNGKSMIF